MNLLNGLRWFTQRVTTLIVIPLVVVVIPWLLAQLLQALGVLSAINNLYGSSVLFWAALAVSRILYTVACVYLGSWSATLGEKLGFFWFAEDDSYHRREKPSVDRSGTIFLWGVLIPMFCYIVGEFAISLYTGTLPVYLPPPVP